MQSTLVDESAESEGEHLARRRDLREQIDHAAHFLPSQGPITVFVHHNTLHAFEHLGFDDGVKAGGRLFGCHAYLPEDDYRKEFQRGRIRVEDLEAVLIDDLGDEADRLVASFGTRYALRLAMLQFPFRSGLSAELRWVIAETDALRRFRAEVAPAVRQRMISETRRWMMREYTGAAKDLQKERSEPILQALNSEKYTADSMEFWSDRTWEAFVLNFLWRVCDQGVRLVEGDAALGAKGHFPLRHRRHRDLLLEASGEDTDLPVHEVLTRCCAAFLDQGFADWPLPDRELGLYQSFLHLYTIQWASPTRWHRDLHREALRVKNAAIDPLESIEESLRLLGVGDDERGEFIVQTMLALRGWAGMIWQMESNAEWAPHPAPPGSLIEFLAIRLILDRISIAQVAREQLGFDGPLDEVRQQAVKHISPAESNGSDQRAFLIFQLAQVRGWNPQDLQALSREQWTTLLAEIEAFSSLERRRTYHLAYERKYRNETLDAVIAHSKRLGERNPQRQRAAYQVVCCIDDREESFRRHLEEFDPECETLGVAGFFGVAMYYRGVADAHFKPLCPVVVKPQHYVVEEPLYSFVQAERRRAERGNESAR